MKHCFTIYREQIGRNRLQNNLHTQFYIYRDTYAVTVCKMLSYSNSREVYPTCTARAVFLSRSFKFKDRHTKCHVFQSVKRLIFFVYVFCYFACLKQRYCSFGNCYSSHCERCSVLHAWQNPSMLKEIIQTSSTERTRTVLLIANGSLGSI